MELKDFVKKVILDLDAAISEANNEAEREIRFRGVKEKRTALEFDVAVTVESSDGSNGGGEIKVWGLAQAGGNVTSEQKNSTVSRVTFGIDVDEYTRIERSRHKLMG